VRGAMAATFAWVALVTVSSADARRVDHEQADAQALDLAKQAIALRSVRGPDNQAPRVAALFKSALVAGGFNDADVSITPVDDTAFLLARWKGHDPGIKPLVISGHMDVVEARPSDWQRDPFTPVIENGLLYGRGASDMKLDDALAVAALIELKREKYQPRRDIVLAFSGDEETTMKTTGMLARELSNAEMVLNIDGGPCGAVQRCHRGRHCNRRFAHSTGSGRSDHEGDSHRLSRRAGIPDDVSGCKRQHVVSQ